jgi:two-component system chemotaxis response regulator CheY
MNPEVSMKILVVDDSKTIRALVVQIMKEFGSCDIAEDGQQAVQIFNQALEDGWSYDLVCMDITMPVMNGQEALCEIRNIERANLIHYKDRVKIIMTTSETDVKNVQKALRGGADAYLVKPFKKEDMEEQLKILEMI